MSDPPVLGALELPGTLALPSGIDGPVLAATAGWLREHTDAPRTRRAYLRDLAAWIDWCATQQIDPCTARRPDVAAWIEHLATATSLATGRPLAASSRARTLAAVSSWYRHLLSLDEDLAARNPVGSVRRPTVNAHHSATVGLTKTQAWALIAAADADRHPAAPAPAPPSGCCWKSACASARSAAWRSMTTGGAVAVLTRLAGADPYIYGQMRIWWAATLSRPAGQPRRYVPRATSTLERNPDARPRCSTRARRTTLGVLGWVPPVPRGPRPRSARPSIRCPSTFDGANRCAGRPRGDND